MASSSSGLEATLHRAIELANERSHEFATLEHLLLSLVDDLDAAAVVRACNVDLELMRGKLIDYLDNNLESLIVNDIKAQLTVDLRRALHRAGVHVQSAGREEVTGANVLVAMFGERTSYAVNLLQELGLTRFNAVSYIIHGKVERPDMSEPHAAGVEKPEHRKSFDTKSITLALR